MSRPLFSDLDEENMARIMAAGIALHALICSGYHTGHHDQETINQAFGIGNVFVDEAKRRMPG